MQRVAKPALALAIAIPALLAPLACVSQVGDEGAAMSAGFVEETSVSQAISRTCADGQTVRGIDVSYWQGTVDWDRVAGDGIHYAFIRVSDGLSNKDTKFARNWSEARRVGIIRGAYQYFRPHLDPIAQANLLLDMMGPLEEGDLPPVIDVEASSGMSKSAVAARVKSWIDHVEAALGVRPIIYSGPYFWRDHVGSPSWAVDYPLWIAHYTSGCPLTPGPWNRWTFHQFTDRGSTAGVSGPVDTNHFNGTYDDLIGLTYGGVGVSIPPPAQCEVLDPAGGILEEDGPCTALGGPSSYLRNVNSASASGGSYIWTGATSSANPTNYAEWIAQVPVEGHYALDVYIPAGAGSSRKAKYTVRHADGTDVVEIHQGNASGFTRLGVYRLTPETAGKVRLNDNTGESSSLGRRLVIDALRVLPDTPPAPPDPNSCTVGAFGSVLEEDGDCTLLGGPGEYIRAEVGVGHGDSYAWTGATAASQEVCYAEWQFNFGASGAFKVEAYVEAGTASSKQARYDVGHTEGMDSVLVDQSVSSGFVELGVFPFAVGANGTVHLADNTGEQSSKNRKVVFDAVRVSPAEGCSNVVVSNAVNTLYVRPSPATWNDAVASVSAGQVLNWKATVQGEAVGGDTTWYRVSSGAVSGYIAGRYSTCTP